MKLVIPSSEDKSAAESVKPLFIKILTSDERNAWDDIEREMNVYVRNVQGFAQITKTKFEVVKHRVGNENFASLSECYDGFNAAEAITTLRELKGQEAKIIKDIVEFRLRIAKRLSGEHRRMLWIATLTAATAVIGVVALTLVYTELGVVALGGIAAYEGINAHFLLQGRTDKASAYLRKIGENLEKLSKKLAEVHACTKAFTALGENDYRADIQETITGIIGQLDELIAVSGEAI